jgi:hypothetical protein
MSPNESDAATAKRLVLKSETTPLEAITGHSSPKHILERVLLSFISRRFLFLICFK